MIKNLLQYEANTPVMRAVHGGKIAMIFQKPMASLNPVLTIGFQLSEMFILHLKMEDNAAKERATELLGLVSISSATSRINDYPH